MVVGAARMLHSQFSFSAIRIPPHSAFRIPHLEGSAFCILAYAAPPQDPAGIEATRHQAQAPEGRPIIAQGNALGTPSTKNPSPSPRTRRVRRHPRPSDGRGAGGEGFG